MSSKPGKRTRRFLPKSVRDFWSDYRRNKIGLAGIAIIVIFALSAILAPWLTPYDPLTDENLAESMAMPQWVTVLPQFRELPPTLEIPVYWHLEEEVADVIFVSGDTTDLQFHGGREEIVQTSLHMNFSYLHSPPKTFIVNFRLGLNETVNSVVELGLSLVARGKSYCLWNMSSSTMTGSSKRVEVISTLLNSKIGIAIYQNVAELIFSEKGEYVLLLQVTFISTSTEEDSSLCSLKLEGTKFRILGLVHGALGTDKMGSDLFSQLVYGSQASFLVGLTCALLMTSIGLLVGVISGYVGGFVDELLMRLTDFTLALPWLPLLLALVFLFGKSPFHIIVLLGLLGWQSIARIIRSQVLSLRESIFIDAAKVAGGGRLYIIRKHIIPNVLPTAFASLILNVPFVILTDAALSFLGLGDPRTPTWGKMLHYAFQWGAFRQLAWWWIIPPGLALVTLAIGYTFIGHAVDEIVNPRLRKRR